MATIRNITCVITVDIFMGLQLLVIAKVPPQQFGSRQFGKIGEVGEDGTCWKEDLGKCWNDLGNFGRIL